ncbi:AAA family ATPase [Litoreibacter arenae]|uniref:ORC1/DEAH AAA+ ATPase domain-containing protein n=1 Tax=Litoreibacter arenae DSM 19593 TaxID=1123360 RepID=S9QLX2_9RHOB|nr:AAA family ATPase [Litoreibacter arenae]EPX80747.1 hypothetical protein thalar_00967 [Litoreibacter arenae DSM 19593]
MVKTKAAASAGAFKTSTPEYDYWSEAHTLAAEQLAFAVRSMILLTDFTGEPGSGKSTVLRKVLAETQHKQLVGVISHDVTVYTNPALAILQALGAEVDPDADRHVHEALLRHSLRTANTDLGLATIIVDDAHRLPTEVISNIFELAGFRSDDDAALFKIILIGQPDLRDRLSQSIHDLLGPSIELEPMSEADTAGYIKHRLKTAHADGVPFTKDALKAAHERTGGRPSLINLLCKSALIAAKTLGLDKVDAKLVGDGASLEGHAADDGPERIAPPVAKTPKPAAPKRVIKPEPVVLDLRPKAAEPDATQPARTLPPSFRSKRNPENGRTTAPPPQPMTDTAAVTPPDGHVARSPDAGPAVRPATARKKPIGTWVLGAGAAAWLVIAAYLFLLAAEPPVTDLELASADEKVIAAAPIQTAPEDTALPDTGAEVAPAIVADPATTELMRSVMAAIGSRPEGANGWYRRGISVADKNPLAAVAAYALAAQEGHARAAYYLGQMYETGEGIPADMVLARHWYRQAGEQIAPAIDRMNALPAPESGGAIGAAIPLFAITEEGRETSIGWTSATGADPVAYEVEFVDATGSALSTTDRLESSVLRVALPKGAAYWRVRPVGSDGRPLDPTGWVPVDLAANGN